MNKQGLRTEPQEARKKNQQAGSISKTEPGRQSLDLYVVANCVKGGRNIKEAETR